MRNFPTVLLIAVLSALAIWLLPMIRLDAQNEVDGADQMLPLAQTISEQQAQITENQIQIEKKILSIQEEIRQAKIYASRSGKGGKK